MWNLKTKQNKTKKPEHIKKEMRLPEEEGREEGELEEDDQKVQTSSCKINKS